MSNEVKTEKSLRTIVLKSIEKLCIVTYTIISGIVMWKERMKIWLSTKKDYITLNIKMDAALMCRFATYSKPLVRQKLWLLSA